MTIDEAIEHAKEVARTCDDGQCAADHIQLAEWLRRARGADKAARWCTEEIQELKAENAKLREERDHWRVEQVHAYGNWEDTYKRASELEAENAKLRELCSALYEFAYDEYPDSAELNFADRMRELRIEVEHD